MKIPSGFPSRLRRAIAAMTAALVIFTSSFAAVPAVATTTDPPASEPAPDISLTFLNDPVVGEYLKVKSDIDWSKRWEKISYQWLLDGQPDPDMWGSDSYSVRPGDLGHRISVRLTLKAYGEEPVTYASGETATVQGAIRGLVDYAPDAVLGVTISAGASVSSYPALDSEPERAYTWWRDGVQIPGADSGSYVVTEEDMGAELTSTVVVSAPGYRSWSGTTEHGVGIRGYLELNSPPVITWAGNSTYYATTGTVLRASAPPVVGPAPAGLTYAYQWFERDSWQWPIAGATGATYTAGAENIGKRIGVRVTPVAPNYKGRTRETGFDHGPFVNGTFTGLTAPAIKGTPMPGQILTAVPGPAPVPTAESVTYEWYRGSTRLTSWDADPTYRLTPDDGGHKITVRARYERNNYQTGVTALAAPVTPPGYFSLPHAPNIRGTAAVGHTVHAETWVDMISPRPTRSTYQWMRDGKPIAGATGLSYRLTAADQWRQITFRETHSRAGYHTGVWTSSAVKPMALFTRLASPVVTGTTAVGSVLKATVSTPYPTPTTSWQWLRNGKPIPGATSTSYKLTRYDRNAFIKVKVVFRKPGYLPTARYSAQRWLP